MEYAGSGQHSTTTHIQVVFDGDAVRHGTIDALDLAEALKAYSETFIRANSLINGRESQASVLVDGHFDTGSFDVPLLLVQSFQQAQGVIGEVKNALEIAFIIGLVKNSDSLIDLLRFLRGTPPTKVTPGADGVEYERDGDKKTVPQTTSTLYYDPSIRRALENGTKSLETPGISSISFRQEGQQPVTLNREDAPAFKVGELPPDDEVPMNGERDAVLTISKLSFREGTKWSFFEEGSNLTASIEDEDFFRQVHDRKLKFADGDSLHVHLKWQLHERNGRLVASNIITKVHRVLGRMRQLRLDGSGDDLVRGQ